MAKRWTIKEDLFLLDYHGVGPDFIATHDLGRPNGAGSRRFKALTESGAREAYARMKLAEMEFLEATGRYYPGAEDVRENLELEHAEAIALMRKSPAHDKG